MTKVTHIRFRSVEELINPVNKDGQCNSCPLCSIDKTIAPMNKDAKGGVLLVGAFPMEADTKYGHFTSKNSKYIWEITRQYPNTLFYAAYSVMCCPNYNEALHKFDIDIRANKCCATKLHEYIDRLEPAVIVGLGSDALKSLGFKDTASKMRGGIYYFDTLGGKKIPVVATFHLVQVAKSPGLYQTLETDIKKAVSIANDTVTTVDPEVRFETEYDHVVDLLTKARAEIEELHTKRKLVAVAVDTETTSLTPYVQEDRVIAISLAWKEGAGIAYPFEHRDAVFTKEQFDNIKKLTEDILNLPYARLIYVNGKFDMKWLRYRYGLTMQDMAYDVMLAEHVLDEDKKGEYGLKVITRDRFPSMGKYEEELKECLSKAHSAKDDKVKEYTELWKTNCNRAKVHWWLQLSEAQRRSLLAVWVERGYVRGSDTNDLIAAKTRKLHGEEVLTKKYEAAVARMVGSVPISECVNLVLPEKEIPQELLIKTFEDVPIDKLLWYAAVDALTTLMCFNSQKDDFARDNELVARVGSDPENKICTHRLKWSLDNITIPTSHALTDMEYYGVKFDRDKAFEYRDLLDVKIAEAKETMLNAAGYEFNPASNADLQNILYKDLGFPVKKRTDSGEASTDADTLRELYDENPDCELLGKLLIYRKLVKVRSTYIDNWLKCSEYDGNIHCNFIQTGTTSYRLSSSSPNLQNVPFALKEANLNLKSLFIPDNEDYEIYDLDISNAEMRVLCAYSKDENLIDAFNSGKDL